MKKKKTTAYILNSNGARILRVVLRAVLSGPKVTPVRVGLSRDEHNHMLIAGNSTQALHDLKFSFTFDVVFGQELLDNCKVSDMFDIL